MKKVAFYVMILVLLVGVPLAYTAYYNERVVVTGGRYQDAVIYDSGATGRKVLVDKTYVDSVSLSGALSGLTVSATEFGYLESAPVTALAGLTIDATELGYLEGIGVTQLAGATTMTSAKFNYLNTASVASLAAATGVTFTSGITAPIPMVILSEGVTVVDDGATVKTLSTVSIPGAAWAAGTSVRVKCSGVITGTANTKILYLVLDGSTVITNTVATAGAADYEFNGTLACPATGYSRGSGTTILAGATVVVADNAAQTATTITGTADFALKTVVTNTADTLNVGYCVWYYEP